MARLRAAIVGCGRIASTFAEDPKRKGVSTHAQAYQRHRDTELVAACDLDPARLEAFGRMWGVKKLYTDFDRMLKEAKPEILSVCTWNKTHEALTLRAAKAGVRSVICEKPIADSLASGDRMIRGCRKAGTTLLINYSRRYNDDHRRLAAEVRRGALGAIQTVSCYYTAGLMNTGTHLFDELRMFLGDVKWVWANPDRVLPGADPTPDVYLQFEGGFGCSVSALEVKDYMQFEIDIYGTKGRLRLTDSGMGAVRWKVIPHAVYSGYRTLEAGKEARFDFSQNLMNLIGSAAAQARGRRADVCTGEDGLKSLEIASAVHESLRLGRRVSLPLKARNRSYESK